MRRVLAGLLALGLLTALPAGAASAAPAQTPGCEVESAELTWGFKESFRAYIDGSIANGEWTVADGATYRTPAFGFTADGGRIDPSDSTGGLDFAGSVRFTGHGDILETTIANPVLVLHSDGSGMLLLDVSGPTMEGDPVDETAVPFATVDLAGQNLTSANGVVTIEEAATALTAEGSAAFPNYPAGEPFDPVTVTIDVGDCDLAGSIGVGPPWPSIVLAVAGVLVAAGLGTVVALLVSRSRRTEP